MALSSADGSIDWWCCPNLDSPPSFDRLLSPHAGGNFSVTPDASFTSEIGYRYGSNVHETVFTTATGKAHPIESLNSGPAGRLLWAELVRRIGGLERRVRFRSDLVFGTRGDTAGPFLSSNASGNTFHVADPIGLFRYGVGIRIDNKDDAIEARVEVTARQREAVAIVACEHEPLVVAPVADIAGGNPPSPVVRHRRGARISDIEPLWKRM